MQTHANTAEYANRLNVVLIRASKIEIASYENINNEKKTHKFVGSGEEQKNSRFSPKNKHKMYTLTSDAWSFIIGILA